MHPTMRTGRALQLDEIVNAQNKVTLGFKCSASLKIDLANEAAKYGMSLSEYVETVTTNRNLKSQEASQSKPNNALEVQQLNSQIRELQSKLKFFYDEPMIKRAFLKNKGYTVPYHDKNGVPRNDAVNSIEDIYKILFKITKLD